jgi:hypothetical protein
MYSSCSLLRSVIVLMRVVYSDILLDVKHFAVDKLYTFAGTCNICFYSKLLKVAHQCAYAVHIAPVKDASVNDIPSALVVGTNNERCVTMEAVHQ